MPRRSEDLFIDNVQEYGRWINQPIFWPHVTESIRAGEGDLHVEQQRISDMSPQHAVSALHKAHRWYDWLETVGRFVQGGQGLAKAPERKYTHYSSPLVHSLMIQAITPAVWNAQFHERAHGGPPPGMEAEEHSSILLPEAILEVAIDATAEWERLRQTQPVKVSPARQALALRDILTRTITEKRGPTP